jgi:hypothetical protein
MSESMYKIIGKAYCTANPDWFWTYEQCPVSHQKAFTLYNKIKNQKKVMFSDSWYSFDKDVCTKRILEDIIKYNKTSI